MSSLTGRGRVYQYELLRESLAGGILHVENITMRSPTLTGAATLVVALMTGCGAESGPTAESAPGLTADAKIADHFQVREIITFDAENPCNGELITFTGESFYQMTVVGTQEEGPDAGTPVHFAFQGVVQVTGTGSESGASYTAYDTYHEGYNAPHNYLERGSFHVTSSLPSLSFYGYFDFHVVVLPTGEFTVTRDVPVTEECRA